VDAMNGFGGSVVWTQHAPSPFRRGRHGRPLRHARPVGLGR
jgi:hypothetical protein